MKWLESKWIASLLLYSDVFHTILIICKALLLLNTCVFLVFYIEKSTTFLPFSNVDKKRRKKADKRKGMKVN
jgi:hypothetical protein